MFHASSFPSKKIPEFWFIDEATGHNMLERLIPMKPEVMRYFKLLGDFLDYVFTFLMLN